MRDSDPGSYASYKNKIPGDKNQWRYGEGEAISTKPEKQRSHGGEEDAEELYGGEKLKSYGEQEVAGTRPEKLRSYRKKGAAEEHFEGRKLRSYRNKEVAGIRPEKLRSFGRRETAEESLGGGNLGSYRVEVAVGKLPGGKAKPRASSTEDLRGRKEKNQPNRAATETRVVAEGSGLGSKMSQQKNSHRKGSGVEGGGLAPITLASVFGENEEVMEIDSPAQSLKKL